DQVAGGAVEGDEAAVAADRRLQGAGVALGAVGGNADAGSGAGLPVVHEHVGDAVGVPRHQVAGGAVEGDEAAVGADRLVDRVGVALGAVGGNADAGGGAGLPVVHEHVGAAVGVAEDEVGGVAVEGDVAAVGADRRGVRVGVGRGAAEGGA